MSLTTASSPPGTRPRGAGAAAVDDPDVVRPSRGARRVEAGHGHDRAPSPDSAICLDEPAAGEARSVSPIASAATAAAREGDAGVEARPPRPDRDDVRRPLLPRGHEDAVAQRLGRRRPLARVGERADGRRPARRALPGSARTRAGASRTPGGRRRRARRARRRRSARGDPGSSCHALRRYSPKTANWFGPIREEDSARCARSRTRSSAG